VNIGLPGWSVATGLHMTAPRRDSCGMLGFFGVVFSIVTESTCVRSVRTIARQGFWEGHPAVGHCSGVLIVRRSASATPLPFL
jgi:hypothetical protein